MLPVCFLFWGFKSLQEVSTDNNSNLSWFFEMAFNVRWLDPVHSRERWSFRMYSLNSLCLLVHYFCFYLCHLFLISGEFFIFFFFFLRFLIMQKKFLSWKLTRLIFTSLRLKEIMTQSKLWSQELMSHFSFSFTCLLTEHWSVSLHILSFSFRF